MELLQAFGSTVVSGFLTECNDVGLHALILLGCIYALSGLDDFFVDLAAWLGGCRPRHLTAAETGKMSRKKEKSIAIIVPAWDEGEIIARMLANNISRIDYQDYHFFVGVYPNDPVTMDEVRAASEVWPNIHAVVNDRDGPTSKGQVLNHTIERMVECEQERGSQFDAILMHDAEDVIHPLSLKLVNDCLDRYEFIQIPVFSLQRSFFQLVAGTYIDEFAESHTKDLLVREKLGAAVPSAGVGTAISRRLVDRLRSEAEGLVFGESSLTEDYELGVRAHRVPAAVHFACVWREDAQTGGRDFIATREYFPKTFGRSVRQKTRWIAGIVFQGSRNLGWCGGLVNRFFLARDRKAVITNLATLLGYLTLAFVTLFAWLIDPLPLATAFGRPVVAVLFGVNVFFMGNRMFQRHVCVARVYGVLGAVPIIVRWPVVILINAFASLRAIRQHAAAVVGGRTIAWAKTVHEVPDSFEPAPRLAELALATAESTSATIGGE